LVSLGVYEPPYRDKKVVGGVFGRFRHAAYMDIGLKVRSQVRRGPVHGGGTTRLTLTRTRTRWTTIRILPA
jgi:hypothetical protein